MMVDIAYLMVDIIVVLLEQESHEIRRVARGAGGMEGRFPPQVFLHKLSRTAIRQQSLGTLVTAVVAGTEQPKLEPKPKDYFITFFYTFLSKIKGNF